MTQFWLRIAGHRFLAFLLEKCGQFRGAQVNEIKRGLLAYLMGEQPFEDFQEWLSDLAWAPVHKFTPRDVELIREIELRMAEFTGGYLSEDELRTALSELAGFTSPVVSLLWAMENAPAVPAQTVPRSSSVQVRRKVAF